MISLISEIRFSQYLLRFYCRKSPMFDHLDLFLSIEVRPLFFKVHYAIFKETKHLLILTRVRNLYLSSTESQLALV